MSKDKVSEVVLDKYEDNQYCLKFKLEKGQSVTSKKFVESMKEALESLEEFNHAIIHGIDNTIQVVSYVEELEGGSIKVWLRDFIQSISNDDIKDVVNNGIVKTALSSLLIKAKELAIKALDDDENLSIEERKMKIINPIEKEINDNLKKIKPNEFIPISFNKNDKENLLKAVGKLSNASANIKGNITFIKKKNGVEEPEKHIKETFLYGIATAENSTLKESEEKLISTNEIIEPFICLTPTAIEGNLWKFEDGEENIQCKMEDEVFFQNYACGKERLAGRQKMLLRMKVDKFEKDKKLRKKYTILEVKELIEEKDLFNQ